MKRSFKLLLIVPALTLAYLAIAAAWAWTSFGVVRYRVRQLRHA